MIELKTTLLLLIILFSAMSFFSRKNSRLYGSVAFGIAMLIIGVL